MSRLLKNHQYNRTSFLEPNNREKNQEENRTLKFQKSIVFKIISTNTQLTKYTTKYLHQHNSRELYTLYIHTTTSDLLEISSLYKNLVHLLFHLKIPANPFVFVNIAYAVCRSELTLVSHYLHGYGQRDMLLMTTWVTLCR